MVFYLKFRKEVFGKYFVKVEFADHVERLPYPHRHRIVYLIGWFIFSSLSPYPASELSLVKCAAFYRQHRAALRARGIGLVWLKRDCKPVTSRSLMRLATLD